MNNITPETDANQFELYPSRKFAVDADFAKSLEIERNKAKKEIANIQKAIRNTLEYLQGVEEHCSGNHGMLVQSAIKEIEKFVIERQPPEKVFVDKKEYEALLEQSKWVQALESVSKDISFPEASEELLWHVYNLAAAVLKAKETHNN